MTLFIWVDLAIFASTSISTFRWHMLNLSKGRRKRKKWRGKKKMEGRRKTKLKEEK
jgi:hypothetical protein